MWSSERYTDTETGLIYLRNRYYDPTTMQFLTRDPLIAQTHSAYGYVYGDPLNGTDPTGLWPWDGACVTALSDTCVSIKDQNQEGDQQVANFAGGVLDFNPMFQIARGAGALTGHPIDLGCHGVDSSTGWYHAGQAAMLVTDLWAAGGTQAGRLADTDAVGKSSWLFGRGGKAGGLLNSNDAVRLGWSWKGSATTGQDVFRLVVGNKNAWIHAHLEIWEAGRVFFR